MEGRQLLQEIRGRPIDIVPGKKVVSINPGEWTSPFEGKGYEPRGYRDYEIGDNPRQIHLPTSARRGVTTIVERVALRDFKLLIVVDLTRSMRIRQKLLVAHEATAVMLYAAWQAETTFGLAVKNEHGIHSYGLGIGSRHFYRTFLRLWQLCSRDPSPKSSGPNVHLRRCLPPNAMLVYCSDFLPSPDNPNDLEGLLRAVGRYDFLPIIVQDELEYSFPLPRYGSLIGFGDPDSGASQEFWVSRRTAQEIASRHEARFAVILGQFRKRDIKHVHLVRPGVESTRAAINAFFRRRRREVA